MISLFFYILIICSSLLFFVLYGYAGKTNCVVSKPLYTTQFDYFFALCPIIILSGLRYGIGADYFTYESIYNTLHNASIYKYFFYHFANIGDYYTEIGWYIINRFFSPNYSSLLFIQQILIFLFLYKGLKFFKDTINPAFALMVYCFTQLIYSWNGMRFTVAIVVLFSGFEYIINRNVIKWCITVLLAMLFHKTSVICLPFYFLTEFSSKKFNSFRNVLLYIFVLFFPALIKLLFIIAGFIPFFKRYLGSAVYIVGAFHFSPMFLFHIIPVILPIYYYKKNYIKHDKVAKILVRIYLLSIPFREIGMVNTMFTRLARFPQMVEVIFIPYIINSFSNKKRKMYMYAYYFIWYLFYFFYYALVNDQGTSVPYQSIITF